MFPYNTADGSLPLIKDANLLRTGWNAAKNLFSRGAAAAPRPPNPLGSGVAQAVAPVTAAAAPAAKGLMGRMARVGAVPVGAAAVGAAGGYGMGYKDGGEYGASKGIEQFMGQIEQMPWTQRMLLGGGLAVSPRSTMNSVVDTMRNPSKTADPIAQRIGQQLYSWRTAADERAASQP